MNDLNKFILKNVSTILVTVVLLGKPLLLNFINEAINGSASGDTRVSIPSVFFEYDDGAPRPLFVPIPVPIPVP